MTERMILGEFQEHCGVGVLFGHGLKGASFPESYNELIDFYGERLEIDGPPYTLGALAMWVMARRPSESNEEIIPCSEIDIMAAESALLIGELASPDKYVQSLPNERGLYLPPSEVVRGLIAAEK